MARHELLKWFQSLDQPEKSGKAPRALVDILLTTIIGQEGQKILAPNLDAMTQDNQVDYGELIKKIFGDAEEFSPEGYREEDGAWLGGADAGRFPICDRPAGLGKEQPLREGGFDELRAEVPALDPQSKNRIKKCPQCGKPNAYSMPNCNACSTDLTSTPESTVPNLFVGMIFGVAKAPFPLKISMRSETDSMIVFDDPLVLTRAHVLAVPTDMWVPDIRSLFTSPARGLALVKSMEDAAWNVIKNGPLANKQWRDKAMSPQAAAEPVDNIRNYIWKAFNLPPSQYQLHLQYMLPPLLPSHFALFKKGVHYCKYRHFPLEYVIKVCEVLQQKGETMPHAPDLSPMDLVKEITSRFGVDYEAAYKEDIDKIARTNNYMANWKPDDFSFVVAGDNVTARPGVAAAAPAAKEVESGDKERLQGYGRPNGADGKPGGVYYKHARQPAPLPLISG